MKSKITKVRNKETILEVSLRLFSVLGVEQTTIPLISKECGISKGLIFHHFENKEAIIRCIVKSTLSEIIEEFEFFRKERFIDDISIVAKTICVIRKFDRFWKFVLELKRNQEQYQEECNMIVELLKNPYRNLWLTRFSQINPVCAEMASFTFFTYVRGTMVDYLYNNQKINTRSMFKFLILLDESLVYAYK